MIYEKISRASLVLERELNFDSDEANSNVDLTRSSVFWLRSCGGNHDKLKIRNGCCNQNGVVDTTNYCMFGIIPEFKI